MKSELRELLKKEGYGMIPESVLYDKRLKAADCRVFGCLAEMGKGKSRVYVGQRLLAEKLGMSPSAVCRSLQHLIACGHIAQESNKRERRTYHLLSAVFAGPGTFHDIVAAAGSEESFAEAVREWFRREQTKGRIGG